MTNVEIDKRKEKIFKRIMIVFNIVVILLLILIVEGYYRNKYSGVADSLVNWDPDPVQFFQFDETLGWVGVPDVDAYHNSDAWVTHNSYGYRDKEWDFSGTKPRILLLGDSNMWGYGVESNETIVAVLRELMPQYEWFNAGMNGYSSDQLELTYKRLKDIIKPDLTVALFAQNDRYENVHRRVRGYDKPYSDIINGAAVIQNIPLTNTTGRIGKQMPKSVKIYQQTHSFALYHLARMLDNQQTRAQTIKAKQKHDPSAYIIKRFNETTGNKLLVVTILRDKYMYEFCKSNNIPVYMFAEDVAIPGPLTYPKGPPKHGHWKPAGFRRAAEEIQKAMQEYNLPKDRDE